MSQPLSDARLAAPAGRSSTLHRILDALLAETPELEAAAVVSVDGLPMASALPEPFDEDRVAAMSAALLSLGERASEGLGRGLLSQVAIEGDTGAVFLVGAGEEAVLVAVAPRGAKAGLVLYEARRAAAAVARALAEPTPALQPVPDAYEPPVYQPGMSFEPPAPRYAPSALDESLLPTYEPLLPGTPPVWQP